MEHVIRVVNERDRQLLAWLQEQVGDKRLEAAAYTLSSTHRPKPYVSAVCRYLGLKPPALKALPAHRARFAIADHYLSVMRQSLAADSPRKARSA